MEREVEERFRRMEALLQAGIERSNQMEIRFNQRMDRAEKRAEQAERRMDRFDKRIEKLERQMAATRNIVELGMKLIVRMTARIDALTRTVDGLARTQKAFLLSMRNGRGGNGHKRGPNSR